MPGSGVQTLWVVSSSSFSLLLRQIGQGTSQALGNLQAATRRARPQLGAPECSSQRLACLQWPGDREAGAGLAGWQVRLTISMIWLHNSRRMTMTLEGVL